MRRTAGVVVAVVTLLSAGAAAATAAPPRLTDESFHQDIPTITSIDCGESTNFTYSVTGTATGPYPGTFTETGTLTRNVLHANFTIDSPVGRVVGTTAGNVGVGCSGGSFCSEAAACEALLAGGSGVSFNTDPFGFAVGDAYEATITTSEGAFHDEGLFSAVLLRERRSDPTNRFDERFLSQLAEPAPLRPGTKSQCKHGGWKQFGFKNQGRCIAFVARGSK